MLQFLASRFFEDFQNHVLVSSWIYPFVQGNDSIYLGNRITQSAGVWIGILNKRPIVPWFGTVQVCESELLHSVFFKLQYHPCLASESVRILTKASLQQIVRYDWDQGARDFTVQLYFSLVSPHRWLRGPTSVTVTVWDSDHLSSWVSRISSHMYLRLSDWRTTFNIVFTIMFSWYRWAHCGVNVSVLFWVLLPVSLTKLLWSCSPVPP